MRLLPIFQKNFGTLLINFAFRTKLRFLNSIFLYCLINMSRFSEH